jgi:hypothetical protein
MKNLILLFALIVSLVAAPAYSASIQAGATMNFDKGLRNPVQGSLSLEQSGIRLWGALGNDKLISFGGDILHHESNGLYAGLGAVIDYTPASSYSYDTSDTTYSYRKHDNGRHVGDKHVRDGKTRTVVTGDTTTVEVDEQFDVKLGIVTGISAKRGPFVENRLVIDTYGKITDRATVGLRF